MCSVLTIAGSDSCCGAGVQADLKAISALGAYGTCAITAITAQNTLGVNSVFDVPASFVGQQIDSVVSDIKVDSLKTGMLVNTEIVEIVCDMVKKYNLKKLVVDPVIKSHKGESLLSPDGIKRLRSALMPLSCLITPNIPEAETLIDRKIKDLSDIKDAAKVLCELGAKCVLIKGGHFMGYEDDIKDASKGEIVDVFYDGNSFKYYCEERIKTENVHGTGCMYSAAIATELAKGSDIVNAIRTAKKFITKVIRESSSLGKGDRVTNFTNRIGKKGF
ncbi:MAG: bifunctional hydroxymethylpyrimidine kinase/phosphomethylpyrimidine kinase [Planctomycetota bacterium]|jgi:hydroxymethylpyrimidine kinase/phosphomethylpyrimidine kinase